MIGNGRIVEAGPDQAERIAEVHAACFADCWSATAMASLLKPGRVLGLLMQRSQADIGLCLVQCIADEAEILTIGIRPEARGGGAGQRLLAAAEARALEAGARKVFLEVSESNRPARALYDQAGYSEIARRKSYYADGSDACILEKPLSGDGQDRA